MSLKDQIAVVTGASRGIGAATARAFALAGAEVVLIARTQSDLDAVAGDIRAKGGKAHAFAADLADLDSTKAVTDRVLQEIGVPDLLINNAGLGRWLFNWETPFEEAETMIRLPYLAAFWMCRAFLPEMIKRGSGRILNVNSPISIMAWGGAAGYGASRWAMRGLSESLKIDLRGTGVSVCHCVFGEVSSNYFEANPGAHERLPSIGKLIPVKTPEWVAKKLLKAAQNKRKEMTAPFMLAFFRANLAVFPWLVKFIIRKTSYQYQAKS